MRQAYDYWQDQPGNHRPPDGAAPPPLLLLLLGRRGEGGRGAPRRRSPVPPWGSGSRLSQKQDSTSPRETCKSSTTSRGCPGALTRRRAPRGRRPPQRGADRHVQEASLPKRGKRRNSSCSQPERLEALRVGHRRSPLGGLSGERELPGGRGGASGETRGRRKALRRTSRAVPQPQQKPATPRQNDRRTIVWQGSTATSASSQ